MIRDILRVALLGAKPAGTGAVAALLAVLRLVVTRPSWCWDADGGHGWHGRGPAQPPTWTALRGGAGAVGRDAGGGLPPPAAGDQWRRDVKTPRFLAQAYQEIDRKIRERRLGRRRRAAAAQSEPGAPATGAEPTPPEARGDHLRRG